MGSEMQEPAVDCTGSAHTTASIPDLLTEITDHCDLSDESGYSTLSTRLVREYVRQIYSKIGEGQWEHRWPRDDRMRANG